MIRIAAVGDVHFDTNSRGRISKYFSCLADQVDVMLIAGDLTQSGTLEEAQVLADDLAQAPFPVVTVLGNHDYHMDKEKEISSLLERARVVVLEGNSVEFPFRDTAIGIAGTKGFGGGFFGACATEFGEPIMKNFIHYTKERAQKLKNSLHSLKTPYKVALLHYSPIPGTLHGEKREIYPFLGSYLLAEAIDEARADIIFHGHAHSGVERGVTFGGIPVRNVAQPVIRHVCNIYVLNKEGLPLDRGKVTPNDLISYY